MGVLVRPDPLHPGRWWVRINHLGKRKSVSFSSREAAKRAATEIERQLKLGELGLGPEPAVPTFAAYTDTWLAQAEARMRPGSLDQVRTHLKRILPVLGPLPLTAITRQTIRDLVGTVQAGGSRRTKGKPITRRTVHRAMTIVSVILGQAVEDELIPANPCTRLGKLLPPSMPDAEADIEVFTHQDLAALLTVAERDFLESYPFVLTLARTGIRLGEAIGLEWRDVDLTRRELLIRRSVRDGRVSLPKNGKTRRVDMSEQLTECLKSLKSLQAAEAALKGIPAPERCFPGQADDTHWRTYVWAPILSRAGLRYRKPHTLRHTYASLLLERRESLHYVQQQLGHHSPAFTLTVYGHLIPREGRRAVDALDLPPEPHESASQPQADELTPRRAEGAITHSR